MARGDVGAQKAPDTAAGGVRLTIHAPQPTDFEVALDEIELDWSAQRSTAPPAGERNAPANARFTSVNGPRAVLAARGVANVTALASLARQLEAANPGGAAHFVLYEGARRSEASRRVLTNRVAVLLDDPKEAAALVNTYSARTPKALEGVPGGYVLEAADPLAAIDLADSLRVRPGVKSASPILKRRQFPR